MVGLPMAQAISQKAMVGLPMAQAISQRAMVGLPIAQAISQKAMVGLPIAQAISQEGAPNIIAELKKSSPCEGILREDFDPIQISRLYQNAGVSAISILTEEKYFSGKISYLNQVRKIVTLPILRKDFIFEPYQLYESKFFGADAVLLIAEVLKNGRLSQFLSLSKRLELDCLVEVGNLDDLRYALDEGAQIIGINNRNLHTLEIDGRLAPALMKHIPPEIIVVAESGVKTHRDYLSYKKLKVSALLIGSAFMKADDIKKKIKEIVEGGKQRTRISPSRKKLGKTPVRKNPK